MLRRIIAGSAFFEYACAMNETQADKGGQLYVRFFSWFTIPLFPG